VQFLPSSQGVLERGKGVNGVWKDPGLKDESLLRSIFLQFHFQPEVNGHLVYGRLVLGVSQTIITELRSQEFKTFLRRELGSGHTDRTVLHEASYFGVPITGDRGAASHATTGKVAKSKQFGPCGTRNQHPEIGGQLGTSVEVFQQDSIRNVPLNPS